MRIEINNRAIGQGQPPYIIAEVSANHHGRLECALETMTAAKQAGADAVKIQSYTADTMTIDCDRPEFLIEGGLWDGYKLYDLYKEAQTPFEWHKPMFEHAAALGITLFSTPFDESAVDMLESLDTPAYKIASFEATDLPLIRYVASQGKPMILSTGLCSEQEIREAVEAAQSAGCHQLVLLHCISSYPAPTELSNLRHMPELGTCFGVPFGLSDHTLGTTTSVAAVALGACVIEKHFTQDRSVPGPDSTFSLEPKEFTELTKAARDAWLSLGQTGFHRSDAELGNTRFRRSLFFVKDLPAGTIITEDAIRRIRPGNGLAPKYYDQLLGKTVSVSVSRGQPVNWDLFD